MNMHCFTDLSDEMAAPLILRDFRKSDADFEFAAEKEGDEAYGEGELEIDAATAREFGLEDGKVYEIIVFHAERQTYASTYKLTLSGFNSEPSECYFVCGDGILAPGEQCDDGDTNNNGEYGRCKPDCTLGPYCGDAKINGPEDCDNGINTTPYGGGDGCSPGCVTPPFCGDGQVQTSFGETCDDGINSGAYGGCTPDCQNAPWCDDGQNLGEYGGCAPGCVLGPRCGDGILHPAYEECDDPTSNRCTPQCTFVRIDVV